MEENREKLDKFFWQEILYLSVMFYVRAFKRNANMKVIKSGKDYMNDMEGATSFVQDVAKEVDSFYDLMMGQIAASEYKIKS